MRKVFLALMVIVACWIAWELRGLFLPPIENVVVIGNKEIPGEELKGMVIPLVKGKDIFTVDLKAIAERVASHPWVETCEVWISPPSTLKVKVKEGGPLYMEGVKKGQLPEEVLVLIRALRPMKTESIRYERGFYHLGLEGGMWVKWREGTTGWSEKRLKLLFEVLGQMDKVPGHLFFIDDRRVAIGFREQEGVK